ncbi:hypothetical protein AAF712_012689 [Marasmius tenuissimus]|uniref:Uncharacterized protein n=1 Tax=Marasmius tenuissimus TaxID=585030 RepID=A0ABR2ZFU1_9AGAR
MIDPQNSLSNPFHHIRSDIHMQPQDFQPDDLPSVSSYNGSEIDSEDSWYGSDSMGSELESMSSALDLDSGMLLLDEILEEQVGNVVTHACESDGDMTICVEEAEVCAILGLGRRRVPFYLLSRQHPS